jgi:aryl-alcohol dehydrogenase-like predicted oxidoreductase
MASPMTRRDFVRTSVALAAGAGLAGRASVLSAEAGSDSGTEVAVEWRNRNPEMRYRRLGRTNFMISEIVCGGDPIAPDNFKHVEVAIGMGLNYLDTSPAYGRGASEEGYSNVIQGSKRDLVFINTKVDPFSANRFKAYLAVFERLSAAEQVEVLREANMDIARRQATVPNYMGHYFTGQARQIEQMAIANGLEKKCGSKIDRSRVYTDTIVQSLEGSLRRLRTDHVDLLMCPHGAASPEEVRIPEIFEAFEKLKQQGKVRFLGVSSHSDPAGVLRSAMETGHYSMAMVAYNIMNRTYVEPAIAEAKKHNFGVINMKSAQAVFHPDRSPEPLPERAGLLNNLVPGNAGLHQKAYRNSLNNPNISAVISNMVNEKQVRENLPVAMKGSAAS